MRRGDFSYDLPAELIAQYPAPEREASRLLCLGRENGAVTDRRFTDLPSLLKPGDLLVFNDTRVIPARLIARKPTGGRVEVLIERIIGDRMLAQVRGGKSLRTGARLAIEHDAELVVEGRQGEMHLLALAGPGGIAALLESAGHVPLPPYIKRSDEALDRERYQTVYARKPGAVAAPTAGLHFTRKMLDTLKPAGVDSAFVTLHVGAGTFQPLRTEIVDEHVMHDEWYEVPTAVCEKVHSTRRQGGRVIAVGTTAVRSLESAASGGSLEAVAGETRLFIRPGFEFRVVDALLTNFHLPESTLLMLVCAFAGTENVLNAYRHAVRERYRFFSYGDAMFIE